MSEPVYKQIINSLLNDIKSSRFKPDEKLPSEKELMEIFQTSRITVTRALQEMETKGIIYRLKGKGSFVSTNEEKPESGPKIISLVLPHKEDFFSGGQQYSRQISKSCQKYGYLCSIHFSENSSRKEKQILDDIAAHNVAGAIIYPISNRNINALSRMNIAGVPIVLLDRKLRELNLPVVTSDNFQGAFDAVNHLTSAGHKRIGFVGAMDSDVVSLRYQGYCRALTKSKIVLDPAITVTQYSTTVDEQQAVLGLEEAGRILDLLIRQKVTAIFGVNDLVTYMLMQAAISRGLKIPEQLSLVGFDNLKAFSEIDIDLTSIAQDFKMIAETCVSTVVDIIEKGQPEEPVDVVVPTSFVEGGTVADIN